MASVIGMIFLYDAGYSIVLLRPKNEVKPLTQSAEKWICMGKWPVPSLGIFSPRSRGPLSTGIFHPNADASVVLGCKGLNKFPPGDRGEKIKTGI